MYADMEKSKQLANVMKATRQELGELLDCDMALMFLYDEDRGLLFAQVEESSAPVVLTKGVGLVGTVAESLEAIRIDDALVDERFEEGRDGHSPEDDYVTKNLLIQPIRSRKDRTKLLGVFEVTNKYSGSFTDDDQNMLLDFCSFASEHILETEHRGDVMTVIKHAEKWKLARRQAEGDLKNYYSYLKSLMAEARDLLGTDTSALYLSDGEALWAKIVDGKAPIRIQFGDGVVGECAQTGNPVIVVCPSADPSFGHNDDGTQIRNTLCVPVVSGVSCIGVMQCTNKVHGNFNDDDLGLLKEYCAFISDKCTRDDAPPDKIERLRGHANTWKQARNQAQTDTNNYYNYLKTLMTEARELVGSDRSTLFLIDKSGDTPMLWAKVIDGMAAIRLPVGVGIVGMSARSEEIINIPDAYKDDRFNSGFDKKTGYKTNTILCIPVWKGDEMIGVLQ